MEVFCYSYFVSKIGLRVFYGICFGSNKFEQIYFWMINFVNLRYCWVICVKIIAEYQLTKFVNLLQLTQKYSNKIILDLPERYTDTLQEKNVQPLLKKFSGYVQVFIKNSGSNLTFMDKKLANYFFIEKFLTVGCKLFCKNAWLQKKSLTQQEKFKGVFSFF